MNKKQAARARRRAAKPEPNMPTVDELVEIGTNGFTGLGTNPYDAFEYALSVYNSGNKTIKPFELTDNQKQIISSVKKPHIFLGGKGIKVPFEYEDPEQPKKPTSNNRPKRKDPTYDHKPRKIVLE